jgi:hypothetical protein
VRNSDRWITPWSVVAIAAILGGVVLGIAACLSYLALRGVDPSPVLDLVAKVGLAVSAGGSLLLQLAQRQTVAKTERNTGVMANALHGVAEALDGANTTKPAAPPPVPPSRPRHAYPATEAAPAVRE